MIFSLHIVIVIYKINHKNTIYKYYISHFNRVCAVLENISAIL